MLRLLVIALLSWVVAVLPAAARDDPFTRAERLGWSGDHYGAFLQIQRYFFDGTEEEKSLAAGVMGRVPGIAMAELKRYTPEGLVDIACDMGFDAAKAYVYKSIDGLRPFGFDQTPATAARSADAYFGAPASAEQANACHEKTRDQRTQRAAAREAEVERERQQRIKSAPAILRAMDRDQFCVEYGKALRGAAVSLVDVPDVGKFYAAEAKRRGLAVPVDLVVKERIRIGMSHCSLLASWGDPDSVNRSVGAWGVHLQMVYGTGGPYVYLENGVIRSFQD